MGIDERLQALTQSVELLAGMQIETEKRLSALAGMQIETEKRLTQLIVTVDRMANIVISHDERLDDLEGNQTH